MKTISVYPKSLRGFAAFLVLMMLMLSLPLSASAHCDTMDGPTVADGYKAIENKNVNYILKWVQPEYDEELTSIFDLAMKVRELGPDAKELAEKYLFDNLVRIHRAGEGAPFTGVKPSGTPIDEKVLAADKAIESGDLSNLESMMEDEELPELRESYKNVMLKKDFDVNDVEAGREYIEAYVMFFKYAEGEEAHSDHGSADNHETENHP